MPPESSGELRPPQSNLDEMLDRAPCGFLSFADDGRVHLINQTLLDVLGHSRDELLGRHVEQILNVGSRIFYQTHWFPLLRLHGQAHEVFLMLRTAAGEDIGMLVNAVRRVRGDTDVYDCVLMRVRERQKFEDELLRARRVAEEASQAKNTFLAVMSHELRTPLNAISGYAELLELGVQGPVNDEQKESLARIKRSQSHLLSLINDILNLARIEAGRAHFNIEDAPLNIIVAEVTHMVEPQLRGKGLSFEVRLPPDHRVRADFEKVQQIVINLLSNAIKFTPAGGHVSIASALSEDDDCVYLAVADTGIGVPADKLASIFEPFVQVDSSRTGRKDGTGLGLSISRDLARGMDGDLVARSTEGHGSTFTLMLPRAPEPGGP